MNYFSGSLWRGIFGAFVIASAMSVTPSAFAQTPNVSADEIDKIIQTEMNDKGVQGLSIAVIRDGRVDWARGYGVTDYQTREPVTEATTFQAASLGKMSAAYAVMMLAEDGAVSLDEPVSHARLHIEEGCTAPTIRQALSHMTGMDNDVFAPRFSSDCTPGARFKYSGQGFSTLGELIAARANKPVTDAIDEMIFVPLGMNLTQYGDMLGASPAQGHVSYLALFIMRALFGSPLWQVLSGLAATLIVLFLPAIITIRRRGIGSGAAMLLLTFAGFSLLLFTGTRIPTKHHITFKTPLVATSLTSTAEDLASFGAELMRPTLITTDNRDLMFAPQTNEAGCIQWGLGIGIDNCSGVTTYWHWGSNIGFESLFVLEPDSGNGVIILTNTGGGLDTVVPGRGGYAASRTIARNVMGLDGIWNLSGQ